MVKIGIHGASGKMGRMIIECLKNEPSAALSAAYTIEPLDFALPQGVVLTDKFDELFANCDVVIDFTIKEGAINLLNYARTDPKQYINRIGVTLNGNWVDLQNDVTMDSSLDRKSVV